MSDQPESRYANMSPAEIEAETRTEMREMNLTPEVECLDCGWKGLDVELAAQACPVCDGRCADV